MILRGGHSQIIGRDIHFVEEAQHNMIRCQFAQQQLWIELRWRYLILNRQRSRMSGGFAEVHPQDASFD